MYILALGQMTPIVFTDLLHMQTFHFVHFRVFTAKVMTVLLEYLLFALLKSKLPQWMMAIEETDTRMYRSCINEQ